jgi:hypothetical protein
MRIFASNVIDVDEVQYPVQVMAPVFLAINASPQQLVAGTANKKFRIVGLTVISDAPSIVPAGVNPYGHFTTTTPGDALKVTVNAAYVQFGDTTTANIAKIPIPVTANVCILLSYILVP